jgi:SnoaL-like domain
MTILKAIATQDRDALRELVAEDVTFNSPVRTYTGRDEVVHLLATLGGLEDNLRTTRSITFVQFGELDGVLHEAWDDDGHLKELTLTLRPLGRLLKAVDRMGQALGQPAGPA